MFHNFGMDAQIHLKCSKHIQNMFSLETFLNVFITINLPMWKFCEQVVVGTNFLQEEAVWQPIWQAA